MPISITVYSEKAGNLGSRLGGLGRLPRVSRCGAIQNLCKSYRLNDSNAERIEREPYQQISHGTWREVSCAAANFPVSTASTSKVIIGA